MPGMASDTLPYQPLQPVPWYDRWWFPIVVPTAVVSLVGSCWLMLFWLADF